MAGAIRRYASTAWNKPLPNSLAELIIAETSRHTYRHRLLRVGSSRSRRRGLPEPEVCTGALGRGVEKRGSLATKMRYY